MSLPLYWLAVCVRAFVYVCAQLRMCAVCVFGVCGCGVYVRDCGVCMRLRVLCVCESCRLLGTCTLTNLSNWRDRPAII